MEIHSNIILLLLIALFAIFVKMEDEEKPPNLTRMPEGVNFACSGKKPGFYADEGFDCQVYHMCSPEGQLTTYLCGPGTIFNQKKLVCDLPTNYNCADAAKDAEEANANVFKTQSSTSEP
uniref:U-scoloptoxin(01)-Er1a n=1 Tax=Ethmostigmus rubripes TaxID=62613 RepID=TX11A_ETHRU|nr:RecName: Full=U-scoloptoxin(01)-Er1a; Short=U-SLPTX(01)-Er1a; Flags: Precursor [Ethmostigmus rubripes]